MTLKRTMCALLAASMLTTGVVAAQSSASAAEVDNESAATATEESAASYGLASNIADGNILHCFDWSIDQIIEELPNIAAAGYTSVQTSPMQAHDGSGHWYWLYQPTNFWAGNELGSADKLGQLCTEADKYGIKVIVDVVANHFAGNHSNIPDELKGSEYYHNSGYGTSSGQKGVDWNNRWQVTHCDIGMPDLNSEHSKVQEYVAKYVDQLKGLGVDGIRWDAAKHIGLPSEDNCQFWPAVTKAGLYNYGEILDSPGGDGAAVMKEYTMYMSVTDNQYGNNTRYSFQGGQPMGGYGNWTAQGVDATKVVYWAESHDTFYNGQESQEANNYVINKTYAAVASRYGSQGLYFSRPYDRGHNSGTYCKKGETEAAFSKEVAAVNHFRNAMGSAKDYYLSDNGCAVITRQGGGAVIVKGSGSGDVTVKNGGGYAKPGTYTDEVSGNTFTVTSSTISGRIGDSGIAVIYDGIVPTPDDSDSDVVSDSEVDPTPVTGVNVYFDNSSYNWGNVFAYVYDESSGSAKSMAAWPGVKLTQKNSEGYYVLNVDDYAKNGQVIFSDGNNDASKRYPADQQPGMKIGGSSKLFKAGNAWVDYTEKKVETDTEKKSDTDKKTSDTDVKKTTVLSGDANQDGKVTLRDASLTLKATVGKATLNSTAKAAADVDGDTKVTAADSLAIQRYDIGIASNSIGSKVEVK